MKGNSTQRILLGGLLTAATLTAAADSKVTGSVQSGGTPLAGSIVQVVGTGRSVLTDEQGRFSLELKSGTYELAAGYVGYARRWQTVTVANEDSIKVDFDLRENNDLDEVVVVGNRTRPHSKLDSPAPVDVIDKAVFKDVAQVSLNQILHYAAPSFNSNTQVIADGSDHIDPASIRGLGPDQVLVLINGKRRHTTSMVNINGSYGKGTVGTDLNAIPTSAIKRIEILRDGAAAQYGSDAIAGVINIILEDNTSEGRLNLTGGGYLSKNSEGTLDGEQAQLSGNFGVKLGRNGGFLNLSGSLDYREPTNRMKDFLGTIFVDYNFPELYANPTGADVTDETLARLGKTRRDYNSRIGQSKLRGGALFFNAGLPVSEAAEFYAFGGLNYRKGESAAFRRQPAQLTQNVAALYPDGFLPLIETDNHDRSLAAGIRGSLGEWRYDFSNTYGSNTLDFTASNTLNASLGENSPTSFRAGGYRFTQNTTNLDLTRTLPDVLAGLDLSFGAEHRFERYEIVAGEENSWRDYGRYRSLGTDAYGNPILVSDADGDLQLLTAANGKTIAGGAQAFPGFRPDNEVNATRSSVAAYAAADLHLTPALLVGGALRYENYSDFGGTLNYKLSARYKLNADWTLRATGSTGFRAPSLHQRYFSATSSVWTDGVIVQSGTFRNDSRLARLLGIPELKEEKSFNLSAGLTGRFGDFTLTVDGYFVHIDDRIIYTGQFSGSNATSASEQDREIYNLLNSVGASTARFFANAIDTETKGVDVVLTYRHRVGKGHLRGDLSGTFVKTKVTDVHASTVLAGKESSYLDDASRIYIESAVPRVKVNLSFNYELGRWDFFLRNVFFGAVDAATNTVSSQETYPGRIVTDLTAGYRFSKALHVSLGANNLFDVYPGRTHGTNVSSSGYFLYSRSGQQFGFNGRYVFAKLSLTL